MVHDKRGLAFLLPPRTGTRSLEEALLGNGWRLVGNRHKFTADELAGRVVFCSVRNHFAALLSWHGVAHGWPGTFDEWLERLLRGDITGIGKYLDFQALSRRWVDGGRPDYVCTMWRRWTQHAQHLIRLESIGADMHRLVPGFTLPALFPHVADAGSSRGLRPYQAHYSDRGRALVERVFGAEMQELGYSFEGAVV